MKTLITLALLVVVIVSSGGGISGEEKFDPKSNPLDQMALTALTNHVNSQNLNLEFVKVLSCKKQVVSGLNYFLTVQFNHNGQNQQYKMTIWVKPWANEGEVTNFLRVDHGSDVNTSSGGFTDFDFYANDANSEAVREMATKALKAALHERNMPLEFSVVKAQTQVVSGFNLKLILNIHDKEYEATIFMQPWNKVVKVTEFKALEDNEDQDEVLFAEDQDEEMVGGKKQIDFYSEGKDITEPILSSLMSKLNGRVDVLSASKQVVSGLLYELVVRVGEHKYEVSVLYKPWLQSVEIGSVRQLA